jgi:hypothetical protein
MKKLFIITGILLASLTFGSSTLAEYDSSGDITISVNLLEDTIKPSDSTGDTTYHLQEGVHNELTNTTGLEVDHSYVWITINGEKILAVDPPKPCF